MAGSSFTRFLVSQLRIIGQGITNGTRRIMDLVLGTDTIDATRTAPEVPLAHFNFAAHVALTAKDQPLMASVPLEAHKASEAIRPTALSLVVIRAEDTMPETPADILALRTAFGTTEVPPADGDDQAETLYWVKAPIAGLFKGRETSVALKYALIATYPDPTPEVAPVPPPSEPAPTISVFPAPSDN